MKILNGKKLADRVFGKIKKEIKDSRFKLRLAIIQIGENPVSEIFIKQKKRACELVGINFQLYKFQKRISQTKLKKEIQRISREKKNSGIIIQLPLPQNFDTDEILNLIPSQKDVDVLSVESLGKFYQGKLEILPPVVCAISHLLKDYNVKIKGKNVVLVGAGKLVGKPLNLWILGEKGTLTIINEFTEDSPPLMKKADILISGVGKPNLINGKMVKNGAIVIDAGTSYKKGKLVGDVDFKSCSKKASYITPVPGGVGPLTVACLLENLTKII